MMILHKLQVIEQR